MSDSNRLEREIEEILGKIEQFPDAPSRRRRWANRLLQRIGPAIAERQRALMRSLARFSMSQVMLLSFLLILGSLFFRRASPVLMSWMMYAGIVLFITSFAFMMFTGRGSSSPALRWRGRAIRAESSAAFPQRVKYWWRARTRR